MKPETLPWTTKRVVLFALSVGFWGLTVIAIALMAFFWFRNNSGDSENLDGIIDIAFFLIALGGFGIAAPLATLFTVLYLKTVRYMHATQTLSANPSAPGQPMPPSDLPAGSTPPTQAPPQT